MKPEYESEFLELLRLNDEEKLDEFLISKGKDPKVICPIMFVTDTSELYNGGQDEKEND